MITISDVIAMKTQKHVPFGTQYNWLFMTIEDNLISKSNGSERVRQMLSEYDALAKVYILHQFIRLDEEGIVRDLLSIFQIDIENIVLEDKYVNEIIDNIEW